MEQQNDTRSLILTTGRRLTAQQGYTGVGLSSLLKEAGVPKGSFYHYFASKEAYGCALLDEFVTQYGIVLKASLLHPDMDARARVFAYFEGWKEKQLSGNPEDRCLVVKLSAEVADLSGDMSNILQKGVSEIVTHLVQTLEQGVKDGTIAPLEDPLATAETLYHMWLGASLIASVSHSDAPFNSAMNATNMLVPAP
ncbi:TetR/AcrR family transcriptional regulator [Sulfitobacter guttiformis]|uniref:TetR family transcriptional regulator n=1 Tax=Sulfitobacter guttiformis TaxID=74349 RepID=A0A420DNW3_9RHOB|nr:TetR/AcrR family transcriptional regulator [Sulfitobacter guttiformis]KIN73304.1 Regulatory protein, TetR [Sulfitobacter guttiformis KCTC 32187]RKE95974.1 TetR family transcriptional regulator [Sulfitobacter guttiformis]